MRDPWSELLTGTFEKGPNLALRPDGTGEWDDGRRVSERQMRELFGDPLVDAVKECREKYLRPGVLQVVDVDRRRGIVTVGMKR